MAITYGKLESEVSLLLGNIVGDDVADANTNYAAAASTSNRLNVDFPPTAVQDAVLATIDEIMYTIFATPRHPERAGFVAFSSALTSGAPIPQADAGGTNIFNGVIGIVRDASTSVICTPVDMDQIASYNLFKSSIYTGFALYHYAIQGDRIYHTRTTVNVELPCWSRPTWSAGNNIPLLDYHERAIVMGAVSQLALSEGKYAGLVSQAADFYSSHLARIKAQGDPLLTTTAESAPSQT